MDNFTTTIEGAAAYERMHGDLGDFDDRPSAAELAEDAAEDARRRAREPRPTNTATRCAVADCERTRMKGWTTCALIAHHCQGVSLYGLKSGAPRLRSAAAAAVAASENAPRGHGG